MNTKINIFANYINRLYGILLVFITVPLFIKYMGIEVYGLVSFFAMLQFWMTILDMGMGPTLSREASRYSTKSVSNQDFKNLFKLVELFFIITSLIACLALLTWSELMANDWFTVAELSPQSIKTSLILMAIIVPVRFMTGFYRGILNGFEYFIWIAYTDIIFNTLRYLVIIIIFLYIGTTPEIFFSYQLILSILELIIFYKKTKNNIPNNKILLKNIDLKLLKTKLRFSGIIAITGLIWAIMTQLDKLVLSKLLTLNNYGYFSAAVLMASGLVVISTPIGSAILPKLTKLYAEGKILEEMQLYRKSTRLLLQILLPPAVIMMGFPLEVMYIWTNDINLADSTENILILYSLGNIFLALNSFPYFMQYARGDVRLHLIGNIIFLVFYIPFLIWMAFNYGGIGSGWVWLIANFLYFILWVPLINNRFETALNKKWYFIDILPPIIASTILILTIRFIDIQCENKIYTIIYISLIGIISSIIILLIQKYSEIKVSK